MNRKNLFIIALLGIFVIFSGCASKSERYKQKVQMAAEIVAGSTSACISACRANVCQWKIALVSASGFDNIAAESKTIDFNKPGIEELMKTLEKPPSKYAAHYQRLVALHKIYLKAYSLAKEPRGSIDRYNDAINNLESKVKKAKNDLDVLLAGGQIEETSGEDDFSDIDALTQEEPRDPRTAKIDQLIKELLESGDLYVRSEAARQLGRIGDKKAVDALLKALKEDRSWNVHVSAAWALKKITAKDYQMDYKEWKKQHGW